jgi:hypothetical protein
MDSVAIHATIYGAAHAPVVVLLAAWVGSGALDVKIRLGGVEIVYESERVSFYAQSAATEPEARPYFLVEGKIVAEYARAKRMLESLLEDARARGLECVLEYVQLDERGDEVGEPSYLR